MKIYTWNFSRKIGRFGHCGIPTTPIHTFIHSFAHCLLSSYYMPGTILTTWGYIAEQNRQSSVLLELMFYQEEQTVSNNYNRYVNCTIFEVMI